MKRFLTIALAAGLIGCGSSGPKSEEKAGGGDAAKQPKKLDRAPDKFHVKFETTKGDFVMEVVRDWAPRGADRFHELIQEKFYDGSRFFRVRPKFVVQFGINKDPKVSELWRQLKMPDDPVKQKNLRGYVSYAKDGPGSRTTQIFINLANNSQRLDTTGFAPFARVVEGMDVVDKLYATYGEVQSLGGGGPDPQKIEMMGEEYLARNFSRLDVIKKAEIVDPGPAR